MPTEFPEDPLGTIVNLPLCPCTFTSTGTVPVVLPVVVTPSSPQEGKVALLSGTIISNNKADETMVSNASETETGAKEILNLSQ